MIQTRALTLQAGVQKLPNMFCPRCGIIIPPNTKYITSPNHEDVRYHPNCLYQMAQQVGCQIRWP